MSGLAPPWDIPVEVAVEHNNGRDGLSRTGHKAYDQWELNLAKWSHDLTQRLLKLQLNKP